jgi:hypothetical protein
MLEETMTRWWKVGVLVVIAALAALAANTMAANKVTVCHRPPGNQANYTEIVVGQAAMQTHLNHGDTLGACPPSPSS